MIEIKQIISCCEKLKKLAHQENYLNAKFAASLEKIGSKLSMFLGTLKQQIVMIESPHLTDIQPDMIKTCLLNLEQEAIKLTSQNNNLSDDEIIEIIEDLTFDTNSLAAYIRFTLERAKYKLPAVFTDTKYVLMQNFCLLRIN